MLSRTVHVEPSVENRATAERLAEAFAGQTAVGLRLADGSIVALPQEFTALLQASVDHLVGGHGVTLLPSDTELSPAEAARILGLSRPFVAGLFDEGEILSRRLPGSRHRRALLCDVLAFQAQRDRRRAGRLAISEIMETSGLPY